MLHIKKLSSEHIKAIFQILHDGCEVSLFEIKIFRSE